MQKIIEVEGKRINFSTSLSWVYKYMAQFGEDPISLIAPVIKTAVPLIADWDGEFTTTEFNQLTDLFFDISISDFLNVIWAVAKNGNKEIPDPENWYCEFDNFPVDEVIAEIAPDLLRSCMSTKKYNALIATMKGLQGKQQAQKASLQVDSEEGLPCETPNT